MRRLSLRLIVAFLTFLIGLSAAFFWFVFNQPKSENLLVEEVQPVISADIQEKPIGKLGVAGSCLTKDGFRCSFTDVGFDGMLFRQMSEFYDSPKRANKKLQKKLKQATKIIKQESVFDEQGKQVGKKVIAIFPSKDSDNGAAELLWTDDSRLTTVSGNSLRDIEKYEKHRFP
jgi:hypothetical protein